jgi:hypothetical protein
VVDYDLREIEFDRKEIKYKQRMQQLENEIAQLNVLNSKIDSLFFSSSTSSSPHQSTPDNSEA